MATAAPIQTPVSAPSALRPTRGVRLPRPTICDWAYAREMLVPMSLGLIVLVVIMAGNFVYQAINSIVNQGVGIMPVVRLFLLSVPGFSVQGIPVGVILGVCLVLNRAVRDNEIIALRVGGASVARITAPFLCVAFAASFVDLWVVENVVPVTNHMAEKGMLDLVHSSAAPLMEGDKYFHVSQYYFYVGRVENKELHSVMIYERGAGNFGAYQQTRFPTVYLADKAYEDPKRPNVWILEKGVVHSYDDKGQQTAHLPFDKTFINIGKELSTYWAEAKQPFSMTARELARQIDDLESSSFDPGQLRSLRVDYFRHFSLPLACFVMSILAAPLSLRFASKGSFAGLVCTFALAFLYQGFDGWFRALGIAGYLEPQMAAWGTNALFFGVGLIMLWRER